MVSGKVGADPNANSGHACHLSFQLEDHLEMHDPSLWRLVGFHHFAVLDKEPGISVNGQRQTKRARVSLGTPSREGSVTAMNA